MSKRLGPKKAAYGLEFPVSMEQIEIEMYFIQQGGGMGLPYHYKAVIALLWPDNDQHRWFHLMVDEWCKNILTPVMGPKDSGKTRTMSMIALADYYCFPQTTLALISSTDIRGLEMRVWGDIKSLHGQAKARYPDLCGNIIDSKHAIATDDLSENDVRDLRKGVMCIPCVGAQGQWVGMAKYVGIKQKRRRLYGDEVQYMKSSYLDSLSNLNSGDFKGMFCGNPLGDGDPLDKLCEPKDGWASIPEPDKTSTWDTRDINSRCINLIGTDSPNFDQSQYPQPKFPYLINSKSIERVVARFGSNSFQYFSQCKGVRMTGMDAMKVITRDLCLQFGATNDVFWQDGKRTKIYAVDAAYGNIGGDRCVGIEVEFGFDVTGKQVMSVTPPVVIPVGPANAVGRIPEDQIADYVRGACESRGIPASHVFFDATGRGSLGTSFARLWSSDVNPIEFGGAPSERPVCSDMTVLDQETGQWRLKLASEHYSKFVTELWYSVRYVIESGQMRNMPEDVMNEGCRRIWSMVRGDKIEIESKPDMKERTGESPDLFDSLATAVEGARRLGFVIGRLGDGQKVRENSQWKRDLQEQVSRLRNEWKLNYRA